MTNTTASDAGTRLRARGGTVRIGSLFTGAGGLDMAVEQVTGASPAWFVEFDPNPSKVLARHWPDVPNYGDVTAVNWAQVDPVDILTAGGDLILPSAVQAERFGAYQAAVGRWAAVIGRPAPDPTVPGKNGPRLSARFCEWLMGWPDGWVTDTDGISHTAALKIAGNGVVPQQAALALDLLGVES